MPVKKPAGRWGPSRGSREERVLLLPADMRPADRPDHRLARCPRSSPARGGGSVGSDEAEDPLLHTSGEVGNALGGGVATLLQIAHGPLDLAAALAQFALNADAGFTNLALDPVAGGHAAPLESAQLCLGLGGGPIARDRVVDARDQPVTGDQGGADGDQDGALGVVAED